ncbi:MAG: hypothetical protein V1874_02215 [Spirochaetota bacterium]
MISKFRNAFGKMRALRNPRSQQRAWEQHGRAGYLFNIFSLPYKRIAIIRNKYILL